MATVFRGEDLRFTRNGLARVGAACDALGDRLSGEDRAMLVAVFAMAGTALHREYYEEDEVSGYSFQPNMTSLGVPRLQVPVSFPPLATALPQFLFDRYQYPGDLVG